MCNPWSCCIVCIIARTLWDKASSRIRERTKSDDEQLRSSASPQSENSFCQEGIVEWMEHKVSFPPPLLRWIGNGLLFFLVSFGCIQQSKWRGAYKHVSNSCFFSLPDMNIPNAVFCTTKGFGGEDMFFHLHSDHVFSSAIRIAQVMLSCYDGSVISFWSSGGLCCSGSLCGFLPHLLICVVFSSLFPVFLSQGGWCKKLVKLSCYVVHLFVTYSVLDIWISVSLTKYTVVPLGMS